MKTSKNPSKEAYEEWFKFEENYIKVKEAVNESKLFLRGLK